MLLYVTGPWCQSTASGFGTGPKEGSAGGGARLKPVPANYQTSQTFVPLPERASLVKLMQYHFESHETLIFQRIPVCFHSIVSGCLHESGCFALHHTESSKHKTPWERCFDKDQPRNLDAVSIFMARLVNEKNTIFI